MCELRALKRLSGRGGLLTASFNYGSFHGDETEDETTDAAMEHVNHLALIGTPATLCEKVCVWICPAEFQTSS